MSRSRTFVWLSLAIVVAASLSSCKGDTDKIESVAATAPATVAKAVVAAVTPPSAKDEVGKSMDRFLGVRSYHATLVTTNPKGDINMEMDFIAPDRYRMKMPVGTQYVIGDTMYITMNGRTMKVPLPKGQIGNYRDPASFEANKANMTVQALGNDSVEGQPAKKYLLRNTRPVRSESTLWVNADGYPLKIEVAGETGDITTRTTIRYSRFNDPTIRIDPPR